MVLSNNVYKCYIDYVEFIGYNFAFERVYNGLTTVHNVPLSNDKVKVSVKEVRDVEARVPVPSQEVWLVG